MSTDAESFQAFLTEIEPDSDDLTRWEQAASDQLDAAAAAVVETADKAEVAA